MAARRQKTSVPSTRIGRFVRMSLMAGEIAFGGAVEGAKQLAAGRRLDSAAALLSPANAEVLARRLATLRGAAMKLGQMLSLQGDEILPPQFSQALAILRSQGYAMPAAQLHRVLGRELGAGWQTRFASFDDEPLAAASIGQVHHAIARDGRDLVLKIQYPGVARSIDSDVDNLASLLRWLDFLPVEIDVPRLTGEAKRQLRLEADYLQEAAHAERFHELLERSAHYFVPRVHGDLTTRRILAMDRVAGEALDSPALARAPQRLRNAIGRRIQALLFREFFEFRYVQTDPNPANYVYQREHGRLALLDFGSTVALEPERAEGYRAICRAIIDRDRKSLREQALRLGYIREADPEERVRDVIEIIELVCEAIRRRGAYDFAASGLALRARDLGIDVAMRRGLPAPPAETLFLHRKLVGTFLLCANLRARIDVRSLVEPFL